MTEKITSKINYRTTEKVWAKVKSFRYLEECDDDHEALNKLIELGYAAWRAGDGDKY